MLFILSYVQYPTTNNYKYLSGPVYGVRDVTTFSVCPAPLNQYPTFVSKMAAKNKKVWFVER